MNSPEITITNPALSLPINETMPKKQYFGWFRVVAGNPFFLFSPMLLLYGLFQVATEPAMLGQEAASLAFNFSSLGIYEMLLVVAAIWLAGRGLRYDASVLMWMENLLLFVPFLLLSQASFLSANTAFGYACIGVLLAMERWVLQYRYFPNLNLPPLLMCLGFGLLLLNAGYPLLFHHFVTVKENNWIWPQLSFVSWALILPVVMLFGNWLCRPVMNTNRDGRDRWLPLAFFTVWMVGTAVNLRAINYVDDLEFRPGLMIPLAWALVWTVWLQMGNLDSRVSFRFRDRAIWFPVALPGLAFVLGEELVFFCLVLANVFALVSLGHRLSTRSRVEALFVSGAMALAGMPEFWAEELVPFYSRGKCVLLAVAAYLVSLAVRRTDCRAGLVGAVIAGITTQYYFGRLDYLEQFALDTVLMFALVHSLSWRDAREAVGRPIRFALGLGWLLHGVIWVRIAGGDVPETEAFISRMIPLSGLLVLACYAIHRLRSKSWWPFDVPFFGLLVVVTVPINGVYEAVRITPPGYLAVLGSFLLFVGGIAYALVRDRLQRRLREYARLTKDGLVASVAGR